MSDPKYTIVQKARILSSRYVGKGYEVTYNHCIERFTAYAKAADMYEAATTEGLTPQEWSKAIRAEGEQSAQAVIDAADTAAWTAWRAEHGFYDAHTAFLAGRKTMREETRRYA